MVARWVVEKPAAALPWKSLYDSHFPTTSATTSPYLWVGRTKNYSPLRSRIKETALTVGSFAAEYYGRFLEDGTNQRIDTYGGAKENRVRFLLDIVDEVTEAIGPDRVGVRLSPFGQYGGIRDSNPLELFTFVIQELDKRRISYLHLIEAKGSEMGLTDQLHEDAVNNAALFREVFHGPLLSAAAYSPESAALAIEKNHADAIAFGRLFIANPDLVRRIKERQPLNAYDRSTFYGGGENGYTDYKTLGKQSLTASI